MIRRIGHQQKHGPGTIFAAVGSHSVKHTTLVGQRAAGAEAVIAAGEVVEHGLSPVVILIVGEFEYGAAAVSSADASCPACRGRAVEIAVAVHGDAAVRIFAVVAALKAVKDGLDPAAIAGGRKFKDGAETEEPADCGGAIGVSGLVKDERAGGIATIVAAGEGIHNLLASCGVGADECNRDTDREEVKNRVREIFARHGAVLPEVIQPSGSNRRGTIA